MEKFANNIESSIAFQNPILGGLILILLVFMIKSFILELCYSMRRYWFHGRNRNDGINENFSEFIETIRMPEDKSRSREHRLSGREKNRQQVGLRRWNSIHSVV